MNEEKEKKALAIKREEDGTCKVVAYGEGPAAEAIIEKAREHDVDVVRDSREMERILEEKKSEEGAVPERIYGLISEIVSFVTELNDEWVKRNFGEGEAEASTVTETIGLE